MLQRMDDPIARLPKAEVHLHLEGTISPETLWDMAHANNVPLPVGSMAELRRMYEFTDFDAFIRLWLIMCSCLRTPETYERMVDGFLSYCQRQNIRYAEVHFTPYNHEKFGIGGRRALEIVTRRLSAAEAAGGPVVRMITDISGESAAESSGYTVELLEQEANPLIVALGLGGPEQGVPRDIFKPWFERARKAGYWTVAHAGETGGPEHVRQAVVDLGVRRVQHGTRAAEDPAVLRLLAERDVCCDIALTSNECLKVVPSVAAHPLRHGPGSHDSPDAPLCTSLLCRIHQGSPGSLPKLALRSNGCANPRFGASSFQYHGKSRGLHYCADGTWLPGNFSQHHDCNIWRFHLPDGLSPGR